MVRERFSRSHYNFELQHLTGARVCVCACACVLLLSIGSVWRESLTKFDSSYCLVMRGLYVSWVGSERGEKNYKKIQNKTCTWKKERQKKMGLLLFLHVNIECYIHIINIYIHIIYIQCILHQLWDVSLFSQYIFFLSRLQHIAGQMLLFSFFCPCFVCASDYECFLESFVFCVCCSSLLQPGTPCLSYLSACDSTGVWNELSLTAKFWRHQALDAKVWFRLSTSYATAGCYRLYIFV